MVFLDLMAERLTFERIATRLYDGLLVKHDAAGSQAGGPERPDLERIRDDELRHFALLGSALESLGADSTAVTPGADLASAVSLSLIQVVTDPRATLSEALRVMLIAELADNDGWLVLADMADRLDQDALAARFREALEQEDRHLARLRTWVSAMLSEQAGLGPTAPLGVSEIGQPMLE
jgi:rubrerythrin